MNSAIAKRLVRFLSVTEYRSGEAIAEELNCCRSVVWKHVRSLRDLGVGIDTVAGHGYLLRESIELLDEDSILSGLNPVVRDRLRALNIEISLDSTNSALKRLPLADQHASIIIAEHQSGGRGRRGRHWHSPFGRNLYLSLGWGFDRSFAELGCLPLVVALATAQALTRAGLNGHQVKWPNDLLLNGRKLCGCLVEMQGDPNGPCNAVLGVGINVDMPVSQVDTNIDQPFTDLHAQLPDCSRNALVVLLLEELFEQLELFANQGFRPFRARWRAMDALRGQAIEVWSGTAAVQGVAKGINDQGALRLDTGKRILNLHSGEASLRKPNKL